MKTDAQSRDGWKVWTPLFFSLVLVLGMVLGFNLRDTLRSKRDIATVVQRNDRLEEIIDLVKDKYVDTVNSNELYEDAVAGILKSLDPHTVYIPAEELQGVNDDLEGSFSSIGIEFSIVRDTIEITSVVDGGPASKAGIDIGDQLIKVGDSLVAGNNITSGRIVNLLNGKQQSKVRLTVRSSADGAVKNIPLTRDIVPRYSVGASIMLDATTGFIKINRFGATTYAEFKTALKKLKAQGATQLVVDLRDNPGGYIDAADSIANDFLDDDKLVVYTKGLSSPKTEYRADKNGLFEKGKLAILINESSASASEILAGAIQDWDRGVIVGRRSFGKGLVQEQYDLPDGSALHLTVARYYTPSGRCIQRSYANGKEAYMQDYERRFEPGALATNDSAATDTVPFYTANHRVVYGGGGIKPDVYVPYDTSKLSASLLSMVFSEELKTAIWDYFIHNRQKLKFRDIADFSATFTMPDQVTGSYIAMLSPDTRKGVLRELASPVNEAYFKTQVKAQLARILFHDNGYYTISLTKDEMVNKALTTLNSPQYSKLIGGK
jgi:carboxyl-terminal processing protease